MKIIFLDIDGVMNGFESWPSCTGRQYIDPNAVGRLNYIVEKTEAKIVITSTWRKYCDVKVLLEDAGVEADIIGYTPYLNDKSRGEEITEWLHYCNRELEQFIILDDDSDMGNLMGNLIKTDWGRGLQEEHVTEAIARLS